MFKRRPMLLDSAAGDPAAGGGAPPAAPAAAPVAEPSMLTAAVAATPAATAQPAAASPSAPAAAVGADPLAWIPEKYRVPGAEGKIDVQASAMKINEARAALEARMGEGGLPPENADGYKPDTVLAALKTKTGKDANLPPQFLKDFGTFAHEAKLTQAQYDKALTGFMGGMQSMVDMSFDTAMANGKAELSKAWGAPEGERFKSEMSQAVKAFNAYAPATMRTPAVMDAIGNHPVVLQLLAAVGKELKEDKLHGSQGVGAGDDIKVMMSSEPYWNAKHPMHASTVAKVNEFFLRGGKAVPTA